MGTRIVIMKEGVIQQIGTPQEIYHQPANLFVAGFIGTPPMNVINGRLRIDGERLLFDTKRYSLAINGRKRKRLLTAGLAGRAVVLGVRAEQASCGPPGGREQEAGDGFRSRIERIEFMGSDAFVHVYNEEHRLVVRTNPQSFQFGEGDAVDIQLLTDNAHFFDPITEELLC